MRRIEYPILSRRKEVIFSEWFGYPLKHICPISRLSSADKQLRSVVLPEPEGLEE